MRVLLVEDHAKLALTVAAGLRRQGMAVDVAFDGDEALAKTAITDYDVVVLDRDLPRVHGDEVCRRLVAEQRDCRVLMLTAAGTIEDRVHGLRLGADDYLPKPFDASELVARIQALGRGVLRLVVSDRGARYPLRIDPLIQLDNPIPLPGDATTDRERLRLQRRAVGGRDHGADRRAGRQRQRWRCVGVHALRRDVDRAGKAGGRLHGHLRQRGQGRERCRQLRDQRGAVGGRVDGADRRAVRHPRRPAEHGHWRSVGVHALGQHLDRAARAPRRPV